MIPSVCAINRLFLEGYRISADPCKVAPFSASYIGGEEFDSVTLLRFVDHHTRYYDCLLVPVVVEAVCGLDFHYNST